MDLLHDPLYEHACDLVAEYKLQSVVETGLGVTSSGIAFAGARRLMGYGCDVLQEHVTTAKKRHPWAVIVCQHSTEFLREILPALRGPALFWLDAHEPDWPLYEELELLRDAPKGSVVLCDDAHFVLEGHACLNGKTLADYLVVLPDHHGTVYGEKTPELQPVLEYVPK